MIAVLSVVVSGIWIKGSDVFGVTHSNPTGKKITPIHNSVATDNGTDPANRGDIINVKSFGAYGDGEHNDTAAIQAAIDAAAGKNATVFVPPGEYKIDAVQSLNLKSGITLQMTPESILRVIPNSVARYALLSVNGVENVRIRSGVLIGDRKRHFGIGGEWGMGIRIVGAKSIEIEGTTCNEFWGDGIYIGETPAGKPSENIRINNIKADQNRRQGLSLISGKNIEIIGARITNTNGTAPAAGIDIEPNNARNVLENINIRDLYTSENQGAGILICLGPLSDTANPISIRVTSHHDDGSDRGMQISSKGIIPGSMVIENANLSNAKRAAIAIQSHDHRAFPIRISRIKIINPNQKTQGAAVEIYRFKDDKPTDNGGIGNITIEKPVISFTNFVSRTPIAFYIWDFPGHQVEKVNIIDPVLEGNLTKQSIQNNIHEFVRYTAP